MKRLLALTLVLAACTSIAATPLEQAKAAAAPYWAIGMVTRNKKEA